MEPRGATSAAIRGLPCLLCLMSMIGCASLTRIKQTIGSRQPSDAPAQLQADCATATVVGLQWQAPKHDGNVIGYRISRDGSVLGTSHARYFSDTSVSASTKYSYVAAALDGAGNIAASEPLIVDTAAASPNGDAPYCHSAVISSMTWHWSSGYTQPNGSDLWPVTWGRDGAVYAFFGDGGGFGGDDVRGRASFGIARISGRTPPRAETAVNVYGGYNAQHAAAIYGKASAIIAVDSSFYTIGGIYTAAEQAEHPQRFSGSPRHVEIAYSKGNPYSWRANSWKFCDSDELGEGGSASGFCPCGFINFGPGNAGAPEAQVYLLGVANSANFWNGGPSALPVRTYLARVAKRRILTRSAYQYFAGLDARGNPVWSADMSRMQAVFSDRNPDQPGCGGVCSMSSSLVEAVYNPALKRYIGVAQGDRIGQTSIYEAPDPWGPWKVIVYNNINAATGAGGWGNLGAAGGASLGVHPVNAWTSPDGRTMWFTYSSDGAALEGALFPPRGTAMDSFNLVSADLRESSAAGPAKRPGTTAPFR